MEWKNKVFALVPIVAAIGSVVAASAYTPEYATSDVQPAIIDLIVGLIVGFVTQVNLIGSTLGLTVALELLIGVVVITLGLIYMLKNLKHRGKK
jgi:FtsH-binding integral membrane protein